MSRKSVLIGITTSVVSAGVGAGITWFLAKKRLEEQYEERLQEEIQISVQYVLKQMGIEAVVSDEDPDMLAEQMNDAEQPVEIVTAEMGPVLDRIEHQLDVMEDKLDEIEGERVFSSEEDKPPLEDLAARNQQTAYHKVMTPDIPEEEAVEETEIPEPRPENPDISIISRDIFMENGTGWDQATLTYFADDGVLDIEGNFIEDHIDLIGEGRPPFGELSDDQNVVYVRNKKLEREFEIIADPGNASEFLAHSLQDIFKPSWSR